LRAPSLRSVGICVLALSGVALGLLWPTLALAQDAAYAASGAGAKGGGAMMWAFYIIGGLTVMGAVATITRRNPVVAAICLVGTLAGTAGLYLLLHATFIAVMQVLVYAGAIMVLFVFVVMAVERPEEEEIISRGWGTIVVGVVAIGVLFARLFPVVMGPEVKQAAAVVSKDFGTVETIGRLLFNTNFLFPFEALSVLLLVAIVGAVIINRRTRAEGRDAAPRAGADRPMALRDKPEQEDAR
jgi:NADH-quinone oxidoreductase subunit J